MEKLPTEMQMQSYTSVNEVEVAGFLSQLITAIYQLLSVPAVVLSTACKWSGEIDTDIIPWNYYETEVQILWVIFPTVTMLVRPVRSANLSSLIPPLKCCRFLNFSSLVNAEAEKLIFSAAKNLSSW